MMPGIAGIIGLNKPVVSFRKAFNDMMTELRITKDSLTKILADDKYILGVVNIGDGRDVVSYYSTEDSMVECLVEGDFFIDDTIATVISDEFPILRDAHRKRCLPYLYEFYGTNFAKLLKGCFNIVVIDRRNNSVYLINSRFGMRALYYSKVGGYFVFSSTLRALLKSGLVKYTLNECAVYEYFLFNYPLADSTYIQNVFLLNPASYIHIRDSRITSKSYWNHEDLLHEKMLSVRESIDGANYFLQTAVYALHKGNEKVGLSLTGGFDSRTILALIDRKEVNPYLYSFGSSKSLDIRIPMAISQELSYNYRPISLDSKEYINQYTDYAEKTILRSDGRCSLARTHYLYTAELIGDKVNVTISGNCGSELIRAVHLTGEVISHNTRLLFVDNGKGLRNHVEHCISKNRYYNPEFLKAFLYHIDNCVVNIRREYDSAMSVNQRFYIFILKEVFRKYFGAELSLQDPYLHNRMPYLDHDFVDFIFGTPFCGANHEFFVQNPFIRMKGQLLYASIMAANNRRLASIKTNRLYSPLDLLSFSGRIKAAVLFYYRKLLPGWKDDYCLTDGLRGFLKKNYARISGNPYVNAESILRDGSNGDWKLDRCDFYKALSFAFWNSSLIS